MDNATSSRMNQLFRMATIAIVATIILGVLSLIVVKEVPFLAIREIRFYHVWAIAGVLLTFFIGSLFFYRVIFLDSGFRRALAQKNNEWARLTTYGILLSVFMVCVLALSTVRYAHVHLLILSLLFTAFWLFDLQWARYWATEQAESPGLRSENRNVRERFSAKTVSEHLKASNRWLYIDGPTALAYFILTIFVGLKTLPRAESYAEFSNTVHLSEAFVCGAVAFHLLVSAVVFLLDNRSFIISGDI